LVPAGERGGNDLNGFKDDRTENGSNQGLNLALTCLCIPSWLDSGSRLGMVAAGVFSLLLYYSQA